MHSNNCVSHITTACVLLAKVLDLIDALEAAYISIVLFSTNVPRLRLLSTVARNHIKDHHNLQ